MHAGLTLCPFSCRTKLTRSIMTHEQSLAPFAKRFMSPQTNTPCVRRLMSITSSQLSNKRRNHSGVYEVKQLQGQQDWGYLDRETILQTLDQALPFSPWPYQFLHLDNQENRTARETIHQVTAGYTIGRREETRAQKAHHRTHSKKNQGQGDRGVCAGERCIGAGES